MNNDKFTKILSAMTHSGIPQLLISDLAVIYYLTGVSIQPGWTLRDLYNERCPMYEKWADVTVDCNRMKLREVVAYIRAQVET